MNVTDAKLWSRLTGCRLSFTRPLEGGKNSRVTLLRCENGSSYVAKKFFNHSGDSRDRMTTELLAISLLREHGLTTLPKVCGACEEEKVVIYDFIEGQRVDKPGKEDLLHLTNFLKRLKKLSGITPYPRVGKASEAFFSAEGLMVNITKRLAVVKKTDISLPPIDDLRVFLRCRLQPAISWAKENCRQTYLLAGMGLDEQLPVAKRLLSPSDFGFHNCLRLENNNLCFLDFEYFGWDDPAKTFCDFDLHPHPAMQMDEELRTDFKNEFFKLFTDQLLPVRIKAYYPLFACKWALILLNEFVKTGSLRRRFAQNGAGNYRQSLSRQLSKAEKMIKNMRSNYERICGYLA